MPNLSIPPSLDHYKLILFSFSNNLFVFSFLLQFQLGDICQKELITVNVYFCRISQALMTNEYHFVVNHRTYYTQGQLRLPCLRGR